MGKQDKGQQEPQQYATAESWKKAVGEDLVVPSGQLCRAKRVDLQVFLKGGKIPNRMRPMLDQAMSGKKFSEDDVIKGLTGDDVLRTLDEMVVMVDRVVIDSVILPRFLPVPAANEDGSPGDRDPEQLYIDDVELNDRMFIFNWCVGGSANLDEFRKESEHNVERVLALEGDGVST